MTPSVFTDGTISTLAEFKEITLSIITGLFLARNNIAFVFGPLIFKLFCSVHDSSFRKVEFAFTINSCADLPWKNILVSSA